MLKKFFVLCLAVTFIFGVCEAKSKNEVPEIPENERIKIAVEAEDKTTFDYLGTDKYLRGMIEEMLEEEKIFKVLDPETGEPVVFGAEKISDTKSLGERKSGADVGELLYITPATKDEKPDNHSDIDTTAYKSRGIDYLIRCEILGIGTLKKEMNTGLGSGIGIGVGSYRRHWGIGLGTVILDSYHMRRTFYCTAVNVKFINADSGIILWQRNLSGDSAKHRKPSKGYDDAFDEAYLKSIKNVAQTISKQVTEYSKKYFLPREEENKKSDK